MYGPSKASKRHRLRGKAEDAGDQRGDRAPGRGPRPPRGAGRGRPRRGPCRRRGRASPAGRRAGRGRRPDEALPVLDPSRERRRVRRVGPLRPPPGRRTTVAMPRGGRPRGRLRRAAKGRPVDRQEVGGSTGSSARIGRGGMTTAKPFKAASRGRGGTRPRSWSACRRRAGPGEEAEAPRPSATVSFPSMTERRIGHPPRQGRAHAFTRSGAPRQASSRTRRRGPARGRGSGYGLGAGPRPVDPRLRLADLRGVGDAVGGLRREGERAPLQRRRARAIRSAPSRASRSCSSPAVSSGPIATRSAMATGPVSSPSSMRMTATPVSRSPAMTARWIGAAPRQRGRSEACRLRQP